MTILIFISKSKGLTDIPLNIESFCVKFVEKNIHSLIELSFLFHATFNKEPVLISDNLPKYEGLQSLTCVGHVSGDFHCSSTGRANIYILHLPN